ncbi:rifin PIR protein, putative [Plasmodium reichenowi]|uniref:Rifin PIR protein, putative n=1 Tax=Plasmodium reichenowi TaxID=5854 RepID=A0A2P9DCF2_PLARE|nr:rifin PIR protein, putative [Plasmodium reichenowi]
MKQHYSKILLFVLPLNILVTSSSYEHNNNNEPHNTPHHTPRYTSRGLSEGDIQSSIYDNDADMKSVKERFDDRTSQRFEEYEERMKDKRQKRKEERDKNIQKIVEKDKMEKSLVEKVEIGCLRCGCSLGGVAASVGLFGGLGIYGSKSAAIAKAVAAAEKAAIAAGEAARIAEGIKTVIDGITTEFGVSILNGNPLETFFATTPYNNTSLIFSAINNEYNRASCLPSGLRDGTPICISVAQKTEAAMKVQVMTPGKAVSHTNVIRTSVEKIVSESEPVATAAAQQATEDAIEASTLAVDAKYAICQTAIIASVVTILVIVLVMIIIYLVLRYRRKKKMKKKAQYTKLLEK